MNPLTKLIYDDMKPALGVTEPGAIAFAVSTAARQLSGEAKEVHVTLNSGMYKNAYTCGIPKSRRMGNEYAAAFGMTGADPDKGLECLSTITPEDDQKAQQLIAGGKVRIILGEVTSRIYIKADVFAEDGETASVTIRDSHTNITQIQHNNEILLDRESSAEEKSQGKQEAVIHGYTLSQLTDYAKNVPVSEIQFIRQAFETNMQLFQSALDSDRTTFTPYLFAENGNTVLSHDEQKTAALLCGGAIEARVLGFDLPAMSITGSGAHGIIATLPLYAAAQVRGCSEEELLRATALSYLVCMYIKEYSGKLSAFCGCGIAAGTGMACGLVLLGGGTTEEMAKVINNMASSITGMICHGGNRGCTMKGIVAVDAAWRSVRGATTGAYINNIHGINDSTPEETMRNMGYIASPGMVGTEKAIIEILQKKSAR